jgi:ABC-type branched-subunit amino acid transport system ATPase component
MSGARCRAIARRRDRNRLDLKSPPESFIFDEETEGLAPLIAATIVPNFDDDKARVLVTMARSFA